MSVSLGGKETKKKKEKQIAGVNARSSAGFLNCGTIFKALSGCFWGTDVYMGHGGIHTNNDVYIFACLIAKAQPFTASNGFLRITHQFYCNLDNKCKVVFMVRSSLRLSVHLFKQLSFADTNNVINIFKVILICILKLLLNLKF